MYNISSTIRNNILNVDEIIDRSLIKFKHLTPAEKDLFRDRILKPNLEINIKHKDLIFISNLCNAAIIYKQLNPTINFAPRVLSFILRNHLPYFYYVFYIFFDAMSISERKKFGFDINLYSDTFFRNTTNDTI